MPGQDEEAARPDLRGHGQVIPCPHDRVRRAARILEREEPGGDQAGRSEAGLTQEPAPRASPQVSSFRIDTPTAVMPCSTKKATSRSKGQPQGGDLAQRHPRGHWRSENGLV